MRKYLCVYFMSKRNFLCFFLALLHKITQNCNLGSSKTKGFGLCFLCFSYHPDVILIDILLALQHVHDH